MARSRRRKKRRERAEVAPSPSDLMRRRVPLGRFALIGMVLTGLVLFFLPTIVGLTPLRQIVLDVALAKFRGEVTVDSASLGWFSPVRLHQLTANDEHGQPLIKAATISTNKSLLGLIFSPEFGQVEIAQPEIYLALRADGSNIEDAIVDYLDSDESESQFGPLEINVSEGTIHATAAGFARRWEFSQVAGTLALYHGQSPFSANLSGSLDGTGGEPGEFQTQISADPSGQDITFTEGAVTLSGRNLPLDFASPLVTRFVEPATLSGVFNGELTANWSDGGEFIAINAKPSTIDQFRFAAAQRIGRDQVHLSTVKLQGELSLTADQIAAKDFSCTTDAGHVRANGRLSWGQMIALTSGGIPESDFAADGKIDVARLASMLPHTFSLHRNLEIESGEFVFSAATRRDGEDRRLVLNAETARLSAVRNGKRINWRQPVRLVAAVRQNSRGTLVESLECSSNFFKIVGAASAERGEFTATGDLAATLAEAKQFFDLGALQLGGKIDGQLAWQFDQDSQTHPSDRPLRVGGKFHIEAPLVDWPGQTRWEQPEIDVVVQASGQRIGGQDRPGQIRIDFGKLELIAGEEKLTAQLTEPVIDAGRHFDWNLNCKIAGRIEKWLAQLKTIVPIDGHAVGRINATASVQANQNSWRVSQCDYEVTELDFVGYGMNIREPRIVGKADLALDLANGQVRIDDATLASSAVSGRAHELTFNPRSGAGGLIGTLAFRSDVNRLSKWFSQTTKPGMTQWFGNAEGVLRLVASADKTIAGNASVTITDLIAARRLPTRPGSPAQNVSSAPQWEKLLEEKQVSLKTEMQLSHTLDRLSFQNLEVNASSARLHASGSIIDLLGAMIGDIQGTWKPNWQQLKPLLEYYVGNLASLDGVSGDQFLIRGPLINGASSSPNSSWFHPDLQVATTLAWQRGQILGMPVGSSKLSVSLHRSIAAIETDAIPFSGGTIRLAPRVDLRGSDPVLVMRSGKLLDQVHLTPDVCRGWLKYVAPLLAEVTSVEGTFSLTTSDIQLPLANVANADFGGAINLHGGRVGPGPLGQQFFQFANQLKAIAAATPLGAVLGNTANSSANWMTLPEQNVPFAVKQGRVYHNGLKFTIDGATIQTRGSVGFDKSMHLIAQVPIFDKWVGNSPWLAGLKGKNLQIQITGTISSPQLDGSVLQTMSQQVLEQAATGAVQNQLNKIIEQGGAKLEDEFIKGLDQLFGPKK